MVVAAAAELSWLQLLLALASAVVLPLILHRIFFHKKAARHSSSAGSETLDDYITKVAFVLAAR